MNQQQVYEMKITDVQADMLRLPLPNPMLSGSSGGVGGKPKRNIDVPICLIETDQGHTGLGFGWTLMGGGTAVARFLEEDVAPYLIGQEVHVHAIVQNLTLKLQSMARAGIGRQAIGAVDIALWDLLGKEAGLPIWRLLGGTRTEVPVYGSDGGWLYMSPEEIASAARDYLDQGMYGIKMKVGHENVQIDIDRVETIMDALPDGTWLAVDANQQWTYEQALYAADAFADLGVAWLEEPFLCEDIPSHARLVQKARLPIAAGENLSNRFEFQTYIDCGAIDILQPDVCRIGGITETAAVIGQGQATGRAIAPHHMMELSQHLTCGLMTEGPIEYMPWLNAIFEGGVTIENGMLTAPLSPGLGLEVTEEQRKAFSILSR